MKKKIALALASVMTFASLSTFAPVALSASSTTGRAGTISSNANHRIIPARSLNLPVSTTVPAASSFRYRSSLNVDARNGAAGRTTGSNIIITFQDSDMAANENYSFIINLTNAEWAFMEKSNLLGTGVDKNFDASAAIPSGKINAITDSNVAKYTTLTYPVSAVAGIGTAADNAVAAAVATVTASVTPAAVPTESAASTYEYSTAALTAVKEAAIAKVDSAIDALAGVGTIKSGNAATIKSNIATAINAITMAQITAKANDSNANATAVGAAFDELVDEKIEANITFADLTATELELAAGGETFESSEKVPFTIEVDYNYPSRATITYNTGNGIAAGAYLEIPVVGIANSDGTITANIVPDRAYNITSDSIVLTSGAAVTAGTTTTITGGVKATTTYVAVANQIVIQENSAGAITNSDPVITIAAPDGYEFATTGTGAQIAANVTTAPTFANVSVSGTEGSVTSIAFADYTDLGSNGRATSASTAESVNRSEIKITMSYTRTTTVGGLILITGLTIVPTLDTMKNDTITYNTNLPITVSGFRANGTSAVGITTQTVNAVSFTSTMITVANTSAPVANTKVELSGTKEVAASGILMTESVENAWNMFQETVFTLTDKDGNVLDGVKFSSVTATNRRNASAAASSFAATNNSSFSRWNSPYKYFSDDGNEFRISRLAPVYTETNRTVQIRIDFKLSTRLDFSGDVYVTISGRSVDGYLSTDRIKIATYEKRYSVETKPTTAYIGYQTYAVSKIDIVEEKAGRLPTGMVLNIFVTEFGETSADFKFNTITTAANTSKTGNISYSISKSSGTPISLRIDKASTGSASTISLTGLQVRIDRTVPNGTFGLVVAPTAAAHLNNTYNRNTGDGNYYDTFDYLGIEVDEFILVGTAGSSVSSLATAVQFNVNNPGSISINGEVVLLEEANKIVNDKGTTYLPLRKMAELMGVKESDIVFNTTFFNGEFHRTACVTIDNVEVRFFVDFDWYMKGGVVSSLTHPNQIIDNRTYVAFRSFANAFGIVVGYDPVTGNAYFNPPAGVTVQ